MDTNSSARDQLSNVTVQVVKTESGRCLRLLIAFGKQRRSRLTPQGGFTCGGEELQDATLLLPQRCHHRHHAFDQAPALRAPRATAPLAPPYTGTDRPLRPVIGRFYSLDTD